MESLVIAITVLTVSYLVVGALVFATEIFFDIKNKNFNN